MVGGVIAHMSWVESMTKTMRCVYLEGLPAILSSVLVRTSPVQVPMPSIVSAVPTSEAFVYFYLFPQEASLFYGEAHRHNALLQILFRFLFPFRFRFRYRRWHGCDDTSPRSGSASGLGRGRSTQQK